MAYVAVIVPAFAFHVLWLMPLFGLLPLVFVQLFAMGRAAPWARTWVDGDGVRVRSGRREEMIPWQEVAKVAFLPRVGGVPGYELSLTSVRGGVRRLPHRALSPFARRRRMAALVDDVLARSGPYRSRIRTSVPGPIGRTGLGIATVFIGAVLAVVVVFVVGGWSPWTRPWWPGRTEASRLPDACGVFDQAALARDVPNAHGRGEGDSGRPDDRSCAWGADRPPPEMSVRLERTRRQYGPGGGASEIAHGFFGGRVDKDCPSRVSGLGDEACTGVRDEGDGSQRARVVVRRGNVLVTVDYRAAAPAVQVSAEARRLAARALSRVAFE
ncbi:hypothetical protein [Actinomadura violacea]|uniref:PH domain-containing protein n=1 Tax=Actinomadura violacea TaxID=2819934 RepID=A0ABS3SAV8_9ACTN|nr:hypothetical protein [Actinomadura violacea]MBO2466156.1 hypothetical protein [Actinomadura violacea]